MLLMACSGQRTENDKSLPNVLTDDEIVEKNEQNESIAEQTTLAISTYFDDSRLNGAVEKFKVAHPNVEIIVNLHEVNLMASDFEKYATQVSMRLMSGTADDIICTLWGSPKLNFMQFADSGLLVDFYELMKNDPTFNPDDYLMNILEAFEYKDSLYEFPLGFDYTHIAVNSHFSEDLVAIFDKLDVVNYDDLVRIYNALDNTEDFYLMYGFNLTAIILENIYRFIDFENKTCNFNTAEFAQFITNARVFTKPNQPEFSGMPEPNIIDPYKSLDDSKSYLFERVMTGNAHYFLDYEWGNAFKNLKLVVNSENHILISNDLLYASRTLSQNLLFD